MFLSPTLLMPRYYNITTGRKNRLVACRTFRRLNQRLPHYAPKVVMLIELDEDILPRHQLANSLRGSVAEWLPLLGRVDPEILTLCCTLLELRTVIV